MAMIKAVRIHSFGEPDVLVYEDVARPEAVEGEVLVRVHAAGINPVDWKSRQGSGVSRRNPNLPIILGWDVSGVVEAVGVGVTAFKSGDEVYGMVRFPQWGNAYAEYTTAPVTDIALKPANLSHNEAAALPLAALTAWQALFDTAHLEAGQTVLIQAAAGGVGHLAVQLAKWKGARVIGTASTRNADYLTAIGVDEVIDYTTTRFEDVVHDMDVVLETMGSEMAERSLKVVKVGGFLVSISGTPSAELAAQYGVNMAGILVHPDAQQLAEIATICKADLLMPTIDRIFPLAQAADAHRKGETNSTRGKLVLEVM